MSGSNALAGLRKDYGRDRLDELDANPDPLAQFDAWLQQALDARVPEASAMTLATVGSDLRPSTRIVLLKGLDARGLVWYGNHQSRKGRQLAGNPWAALQWHWVELERVVRVEGRVEPLEEQEAERYFHSRPLASRIGAWSSAQSRPVPSRQALEAQFAEASARLGKQPPRPPHWGGWRLAPDYWEFWQGRASRLHDRLVYHKEAAGWRLGRLAP